MQRKRGININTPTEYKRILRLLHEKMYVDGAIWTHQTIKFSSQTTPCRGVACETSPSPVFGRRSQSCGMKQEEEMMK